MTCIRAMIMSVVNNCENTCCLPQVIDGSLYIRYGKDGTSIKIGSPHLIDLEHDFDLDQWLVSLIAAHHDKAEDYEGAGLIARVGTITIVVSFEDGK